MKKRGFQRMALLGLTSGLLLVNAKTEGGDESGKNNLNSRINKSLTSNDAANNSKDNDDPNNSNLGYHLMTEDELLIELNDEGTKMYNSLSPESKKLALQVASMRCAQTNPCAGLNACATEKNDCAGKSQCKGTGKCAVSDKNLAVKLVYDKMADKRSGALRNSNY